MTDIIGLHYASMTLIPNARERESEENWRKMHMSMPQR